MSPDCLPTATSTEQVSAAMPISSSVYPTSRMTLRTTCW